jgi:hypothetical protein
MDPTDRHAQPSSTACQTAPPPASRLTLAATRSKTPDSSSISPAIDATDLTSALRAAFVIGQTRTMQQDVTYGLRQLVDVSVKALSPGINDPTTAQDAIFHTAAVLSELLRHDPPPAVTIDRSRRLVMAQQPSHRELVQLAYDEPRRAAAAHPTVCLYLLATLDSLIETLEAAGLERRTTELTDKHASSPKDADAAPRSVTTSNQSKTRTPKGSDNATRDVTIVVSGVLGLAATGSIRPYHPPHRQLPATPDRTPRFIA